MTPKMIGAIKTILVAFAPVLLLPQISVAQTNTLLPTPIFHAIRDESSGELPLVAFRDIVSNYSGYAPSIGGNQTAEYIARRLREYGLEDIKIEGFPADGKKYYWAFLGEPSWDGEVGVLTMTKPHVERLADFSVERNVLGRYSTSADVTSELVDVGTGTSPSDLRKARM